jgi:acetyl esterase/lipase
MADRVTIEEGVVVGKAGTRDLQADVFTPPGEVRDAPAVLLVHGGGWATGDRTQLRGYGILLGREGYVCMACEYRLNPEAHWPDHIHDVKAALRWMRANAGSLGIDPDRIAIEGNSAGAHLALFAAGTPNHPDYEGDGGNPGVDTSVKAAIGIYAPTLFSSGEQLAVLTTERRDGLAESASPLSYVTESYPPTMLIHGTGDTTVAPKASLVMYEALVKARRPVELHMYAEQPHAFDSVPRYGRQCAAEMKLFLDSYV